jgi:hypothetical protein
MVMKYRHFNKGKKQKSQEVGKFDLLGFLARQ